jgi:hypothetical protein
MEAGNNNFRCKGEGMKEELTVMSFDGSQSSAQINAINFANQPNDNIKVVSITETTKPETLSNGVFYDIVSVWFYTKEQP